MFLSSPGHVADERNLAGALLEDELPYRPLFKRHRVGFELVSWDGPAARVPMLATRMPQEAMKPQHAQGLSACDVVVVALRGRMGAPLPDDIRKPDADRTPYLQAPSGSTRSTHHGQPSRSAFALAAFHRPARRLISCSANVFRQARSSGCLMENAWLGLVLGLLTLYRVLKSLPRDCGTRQGPSLE